VSHIGFASLQLDTVYNNMVIELEKGKLNLTEVVVQANNTGNPFSTIGKVDMLQHPIQSSQDVLRLVPGLFIGQHQAGGKAEQIFLRGFDIEHGTDVQLRVDGMPVNLVSHAHGQGYADLHFLIPELIDKE
jgi:outer membrane cobalamin receptor